MKENGIETTIKQLELILKARREHKEIIECVGGSCMNCDPDIKALVKSIDILSDYKRVLQENEYMHNELDKQQTKINKYAKENEELNLKYYMLYTGKIENLKAQEFKIKSQVIPVQKVKDKIEELKINLVNMQGEELLIYESKIDVLQELLEGRK